MASPLLPYANARVIAAVEGAPTIVDGRFVAGAGANHLFKCFMKRAQYTGVSSDSWWSLKKKPGVDLRRTRLGSTDLFALPRVRSCRRRSAASLINGPPLPSSQTRIRLGRDP